LRRLRWVDMGTARPTSRASNAWCIRTAGLTAGRGQCR
jgi:hypothetical protein